VFQIHFPNQSIGHVSYKIEGTAVPSLLYVNGWMTLNVANKVYTVNDVARDTISAVASFRELISFAHRSTAITSAGTRRVWIAWLDAALSWALNGDWLVPKECARQVSWSISGPFGLEFVAVLQSVWAMSGIDLKVGHGVGRGCLVYTWVYR
jgi:hypothetical protein